MANDKGKTQKDNISKILDTMNCSKYYIPDLTLEMDKLRVIFVLESPYSDEVIHRHPVAGNSGLSMSSFLHFFCKCKDINPEIPLGCQIFNNSITNIGVINCSRFPLDKNVYGCQDISNSFPIDSFDVIRKQPKPKKRSNADTDRIHKHLLKGFISRAQKIASLNTSVLFVPCGKLAKNFLEECHLAAKRVYLKNVPHPSRNQWSQQNKFEDFRAFIELIESTLTYKD